MRWIHMHIDMGYCSRLGYIKFWIYVWLNYTYGVDPNLDPFL